MALFSIARVGELKRKLFLIFVSFCTENLAEGTFTELADDFKDKSWVFSLDRTSLTENSRDLLKWPEPFSLLDRLNQESTESHIRIRLLEITFESGVECSHEARREASPFEVVTIHDNLDLHVLFLIGLMDYCE